MEHSGHFYFEQNGYSILPPDVIQDYYLNCQRNEWTSSSEERTSEDNLSPREVARYERSKGSSLG